MGSGAWNVGRAMTTECRAASVQHFRIADHGLCLQMLDENSAVISSAILTDDEARSLILSLTVEYGVPVVQ